jgi:hypothetical protein
MVMMMFAVGDIVDDDVDHHHHYYYHHIDVIHEAFLLFCEEIVSASVQ